MTVWLVTLTPTGREPRRPVAHAFDKGWFVPRCRVEPKDADRRDTRPGDDYCPRCTESPRR